MSSTWTLKAIDYPESDGTPMGETDVHIDWIIRIRDILRNRYRGQRVYVANNLLLYYRQGDPQEFVVPDGFVVLDGCVEVEDEFRWSRSVASHLSFPTLPQSP